MVQKEGVVTPTVGSRWRRVRAAKQSRRWLGRVCKVIGITEFGAIRYRFDGARKHTINVERPEVFTRDFVRELSPAPDAPCTCGQLDCDHCRHTLKG